MIKVIHKFLKVIKVKVIVNHDTQLVKEVREEERVLLHLLILMGAGEELEASENVLLFLKLCSGGK